MQWNDNMDEAPRDGTHILSAWIPSSMPRWVIETIFFIDGKWKATWSHDDVYSTPTHWMPLPEPPK